VGKGDGMQTGTIVIGIDPALKDGIVSIVGGSEDQAFRIDMNWRHAVGVLVSLHEMVHCAAEKAGHDEEQVHEEMRRVLTELALSDDT
jgi:hypothetical protein